MVAHMAAQGDTGGLLGAAEQAAIFVVAIAIIVPGQMLAQTALVAQPAAAQIALHLGDWAIRMQRLLVYQKVGLRAEMYAANVTDHGRKVRGVHALYVRRQLQFGAEAVKGKARGRSV